MKISASVILKNSKEIFIERKHPWVFSGAIENIEGSPVDGSWVVLKNKKEKILGYGHYQEKGSIRVRLLSFNKEIPSNTFYHTKIEKALALRKFMNLPSTETNAFRLINAEGDECPGLIIDIYNQVAVIQAHSLGMDYDKEIIAEAIQSILGKAILAIYYRSASNKNQEKNDDCYLMGSASIVSNIIKEEGIEFIVDWEKGQKTGFFLDQRENRLLLRKFSHNKKCLNLFSYTGGFTVNALMGGATLAHSVDSSELAIQVCDQNIKLNNINPDRSTSFIDDSFHFLEKNMDKYNLIILDPPAFAKKQDAKLQALKGYQRLNLFALKAIQKNSILFTFSCSQAVDKQSFYDTVISAILLSNREVKIIQQLTQAIDHPISAYCSESEYLKGLVLWVGE